MKKLSLFWLFCVLSSIQTFAQRDILEKPLGSFSLQENCAWLKDAFDQKIPSQVTTVGLGEISHGSTELFQFKAKAIQYLVTEKGFRQVLFEYPDAALLLLKRYLSDHEYDNPATLKYLVNQSFGNAIRDSSFINLFQWIKDYNQMHQGDEISIAGFDLVGAAPGFVNYFKAKFTLEPAAALALDTAKWRAEPVRITTKRLLNYIKSVELKLKPRMGNEWKSFADLAKNAEAELEHDALIGTNVYRASKYRDSVMAERILELNTRKSIVWSHNLHCTTADLAVSSANFIKKKIGSQYFSILTDFSKVANVTVLGKGGLENTVLKSDRHTLASQLLAKRKMESGIVFYSDFDQRKFDLNVGFIDRNGKYYYTGKGKAFDALVIFKELNPAN